MSNEWIDFKALRAELDFGNVLEHYGVKLNCKGKQHHGFCPLPGHNGKRNSPSFSANLERGIFQCFGCGAKGNVLEFATLMEKANPQDGSAPREVALKLKARFCDGAKQEQPAQPPLPEKPTGSSASVLINPPLDFELKGLNPEHPYLMERGFSPETIRRFGLGFCARGMLKDRISKHKYGQPVSLH